MKLRERAKPKASLSKGVYGGARQSRACFVRSANNAPVPRENSIIIPTLNEGKNLKILIPELYEHLCAAEIDNITEIIIVDDDSQDETLQIIASFQQELPLHFLRLHVRKNERGLSSAVLKGFEMASGHYLMCMDADGQHPVNAVRKILAASRFYEFVIGTRKAGGSTDVNFPVYRRLMSKTGQVLVLPLTKMSDPMTGMFAITKHALERASGTINPCGFKIALELYVKCSIKEHWEVPIQFGVRQLGESKLGSRIMMQYLFHIILLYMFSFVQLVKPRRSFTIDR
jgi:dolichol-phosphate mannosyltransferase